MANPLDLPEVLNVILSNLDNGTLLQCRLVCKLWNEEAKKLLQNQVVAQPNHPSHQLQFRFGRYCANYVDGVSIKLTKFRFRIAVDDAPKLGFTTVEGLENCLTSLKYHLKSLTLFIQSPTTPPFKQLLRLIYSYLPNLESLKVCLEESESEVTNYQHQEDDTYPDRILAQLESIDIQGSSYSTELSDFGLFAKTLIATAINLKCLKVAGLKLGESSDASLTEINTSINSRCLQKLKLGGVWASPGNLNALSTHVIRFPLKTVTLDIDMYKTELVDIKNFLSTYSNLLESLTLCCYSRRLSKEPSFHFPLGVHMAKLRSLELYYLDWTVLFNWSDLPELKQLRLDETPCLGLKSSALADPSHFSLESIVLVNPLESNEAVFTVFTEMKGTLISCRLTSLELWFEVTPQIFQLVIDECANLKEFEVSVSDQINDKVLCGVADSEEHQLNVIWPDENIRDEEENQEEKIDQGFRNLILQAKSLDHAPRRTFPYIGDLKHLKILRLFHMDRLSETSILHGIVHCSALRELCMNSEMLNVQRATGIIRQAGLKYLTSVELNDDRVNHLP